MPASSPITVVGESLVDVVHAPGGEVRAHPGGSPANVAVGLARLGAPVTLLTRFAEGDVHGGAIAAHLRGNRVVLAPGAGTAAVTSIAEAHLDASGAATYDFRIVWDLGEDGPPPEVAPGSVAVHTGSIAAVLEPGATTVRELLGRVRGTATVSYDPNCRPTLMGSAEEARTTVENLVELSDVVKVSDEDLRWLYPERTDEDVARAWLGLGPALVVVTRGADGAFAVTAAGEVTVAGEPVEVADTVGAGDAFTAGLLAGLRERDLLGPAARPRLAALAGDEMRGLLSGAQLVAAITVSRPGADPPSAAELAASRSARR